MNSQSKTGERGTDDSDSEESYVIGDSTPKEETETTSSESADGTAEKRLYIVDFEDEAERKRVDSAIDSWDGGDGGRPSGAIRVAEGENHDELLDIMTAKVPVEHIECYKMDAVEVDNPTVVNILELEVTDSKDSVDTLLNFIITSHRGNMVDPRGSLELEPEAENMEDIPLYRVGNKKGTVKVAYEVIETETGCHIRIGIKGHHIPADYVQEIFEDDLDRFERSKQQQGGDV